MTLKSHKKMSKVTLFDPEDFDSYFFGDLTRSEANLLLNNQKESGVFLIRNSSTKKGDKVLCVLENGMVSHYIINYSENSDSTWTIGNNKFPDIPSLLRYYTIHVLSHSALKRPADHVDYIALKSFSSKDPEYLSFDEGTVFSMYHRQGTDYFKMKSENGEVGLVSAKLVEKYDPNEHIKLRKTVDVPSSRQLIDAAKMKTMPARAIVCRDRCPNAYDPGALHIKKGDFISVTAIHDDGMWEAEMESTRQKGFVPFMYIKFHDEVHFERDTLRLTDRQQSERRSSHAI